jgi:hypothetical protein
VKCSENLAKSRIHEAAAWCGHELAKSKKYNSNEFYCSFEITSVRGGLFERIANEWVSANECIALGRAGSAASSLRSSAAPPARPSAQQQLELAGEIKFSYQMPISQPAEILTI